MKNILVFSALVLLSLNLYADTYSIVMQPPNGDRIPKVIGASGNIVPLTGYDYFEWFGITHHRTWFKPPISSLPYDISVNTASAFKTACEAIRKEPLTQALSTNYYIDWNSFNSAFDIQIRDDVTRLSKLGIESMICNTTFVSKSSITGDWVAMFKYWKSWYAMVYYFGSKYNTTMYEFSNEPHAFYDYNTWESHWLVAADAMQKAMEDVNKDYGKSLPIYICGPTEPGPYWNYSLPDPYADVHGWGSVSWAKVKYDLYGNYDVNNPWNFGMFDYHRYTPDAASSEKQILDTRQNIANAKNDPNPDIPLLISEYNTNTGANFTTKKIDTEDLFYGISMAQILQATAGLGAGGLGNEGGLFQFKLGAERTGGPYEGIQNRVCYTSTTAPNNYGGITRGGACFQMYATHFRGGKEIVPFDVVSVNDPKCRTIAALDAVKKLYYIYGSNLNENVKNVTIDLNALDISAGTSVTIQRVDTFNTGQITEILTLDATKKLSFSVPGSIAYLVTIPKGDSALEKTIIEPTDDTMQNVFDNVIHGSETTMKVSLHHTNPAERSAAFIRFNVNDVDTMNRALLRLSGKNIGANQSEREILHVYAVSNKNWSEGNSMEWTSAPGVGRYYINSTTMGIANGLGGMVDIEDNYAGVTNGTGKGLGIHGKFLGAISFYSNAYQTNYLDVTDYLKSVASGSTADVTFVIARIVRYNVNHFTNPYYYTLGDYHYDGRIVEIASKENANSDLRPAIVTLADTVKSVNSLVESIVKKNVLSVFPNPVNDFLTINLVGVDPIGIKNASVFNSNGRLIEEIPVNSGHKILNVKHLPTGLYYIVIQGKELYRTASFVKR